jgi:uncharacterized protein (TIGR02996 family)
MTDTELALLRAIAAHPDEDTPRLVFADYLDELGGEVNVAWAKGIRAQIWLARDTTNSTLSLRARAFQSRDNLERVLNRLRLSELVHHVRDWERGFPTHVSGPFAKMSAAWPQLVSRVPIRSAQLPDVTDEALGQLVTWPGLDRLVSLSLNPWWTPVLSDGGLLALAKCSAFSNLRALEIGSTSCTDDGARALLHSPHLARLKRLEMTRALNSVPLSPPVRRQLQERFGRGAAG